MGRGLARAGFTPNSLTTIGLLATLADAALIASGRWVVGGLLLIPVLLIDVLDGALARETGTVTAWGGFYDSVCDRLGDGAILGAIAWSVRADADALAPTILALATSGLVPYTRAKAEAFGFRAVAGPGERFERSVLIILALVFDLVAPIMWVLVLLSAFTAFQRSWSARAQSREGP